MEKRKTVIAVIGESGSGKTYFVNKLREKYNIPVIVSHTTRPIRDGEIDGVDHYFVNNDYYEKLKQTHPERIIAYNCFNRYHYFATSTLLETTNYPAYTYVIDEVGYLMLKSKLQFEYDFVTVYINASKETKIKRGVTEDRMKRDEEREVRFPAEFYDYLIANEVYDSSAFDSLIDEIGEKYKPENK